MPFFTTEIPKHNYKNSGVIMSSTSVLLATRKRPELAEKSIDSLVSRTASQKDLEILLAIDPDDTETKTWLDNHYRAKFEQTYPEAKLIDVVFSERLGYSRMNEYLNKLCEVSTKEWLFVWNDDATMETENWDELLYRMKGFFGLVRAQVSNHNHPFALFPIVPRTWYNLLGYLSPNAQVDRFIYEVGHRVMVQQFLVNVPIYILHDRFDITGNNNDEVYKERVYMEGDPKNPMHIDSPEIQAIIWRDSMKVTKHLAKARGLILP